MQIVPIRKESLSIMKNAYKTLSFIFVLVSVSIATTLVGESTIKDSPSQRRQSKTELLAQLRDQFIIHRPRQTIVRRIPRIRHILPPLHGPLNMSLEEATLAYNTEAIQLRARTASEVELEAALCICGVQLESGSNLDLAHSHWNLISMVINFRNAGQSPPSLD